MSDCVTTVLTISDFLQGVLMLACLVTLPFVGIAAAGGWGEMIASLRAQDPALLDPMGSYGLIALYPVLGYVRWAKTAENSTDYSIQNTVKQALFLPTTREQKYKAKQVTDSFSQRAGDTLAGLTTVVIVYLLSTNIRAFALVSVAVIAVWLFVAWRIGRMYRELVASGGPPVQSPRRKAAVARR